MRGCTALTKGAPGCIRVCRRCVVVAMRHMLEHTVFSVEAVLEAGFCDALPLARPLRPLPWPPPIFCPAAVPRPALQLRSR